MKSQGATESTQNPPPPPFILFYDANNKLKQAKCVILEHFLSARLYTICNTDFFRRMYIGGLHVSDTVSPRGGGGLVGGGLHHADTATADKLQS